MRILISAYACNPASSKKLHPGEDWLGWQLVNQVALRHDVWIITHEYNRASVELALHSKALPGARFCFVELPKIFWQLYKVAFGERIYYYLWQIRAWRYARKLHRDIGFDISHHLTFGNDWIASWIGAFLPVPFVWGPVGGGHRTPGPLWKEYTLAGKFAEGMRQVAQWFGRRDPVRMRAVRRAGTILVCNRETRDRLPDCLKRRVELFPVNGIAPEDLVPDEDIPTRSPEDKFQVFMAGRFHRLKGFALGIRAFLAFAEACPNVEFLIVGDGPEKERLQALIRDSGRDGAIRLCGWLPRQEILQEMRRSHAFLFPSFREGGGAVVVEAMAQGVPVLCLDTGGPGFHVQSGWGFKAAPGDPSRVVSEFAAELERLYGDEMERRRIGARGRRRAEEYYLWDRLGDRLGEIYCRTKRQEP